MRLQVISLDEKVSTRDQVVPDTPSGEPTTSLGVPYDFFGTDTKVHRSL